VAVGAFDAHMGAVGTQIREKSFVMILGTSACDMAVASHEVVGNKLIGGICGQVDGSILPGMVGLEAGQSSFGDVYAWFRDVVMWPVRNMLSETALDGNGTAEKAFDQMENTVVNRLSEEAAKLGMDEYWPVSIDWLNGRRTPYADQRMKGAVVGLSLGTDAVRIFKSLVESTAFGARAIIERFQEEGIEIEEIVAAGGIPKKSPYVMQVMSDVMGMPVKVTRTDQSGALGGAMFAAVAAGLYGSVGDAQDKMGSGFITTYHPDKKRAAFYNRMYGRYREIGAFLEEQFSNQEQDPV
jgi:L-ribulokinase